VFGVGLQKALEGLEFLFKIISHVSVLVLPEKIHGKLRTKIQERGDGGEELSFCPCIIWCLSAHG